MSDIAIRVEGLGKRYRIGAAAKRHDSFRQAIAHAAAAPFRNMRRLRGLGNPATGTEHDSIWALQDVSFEVRHGEVLGIIGRNGAGKSTLLKILSRITDPTRGRVEIHGRVGALLEVGTGFHPELTGRDNIYLNGSILGMDRAYIDRKFDEIVEFSGVEKFIDTPVKRYSSGMYLRLAFSVAAHLEPDILVVDEVLAVGDAEFQKKCLSKMNHAAKEGRTVMLVSHNMAALGALATRCVVLVSGELVTDGPTEETIRSYMSFARPPEAPQLGGRADRKGNGAVRFESLTFLDPQGRAPHRLRSGDTYKLEMAYRGTGEIRAPELRATIYNSLGQPLIHFDSTFGSTLGAVLPSCGAVELRIKRLPLTRGEYSVNVSMMVNGDLADHVDQAIHFYVDDGAFFATGRNPVGTAEVCLVEHEWISISSTRNLPKGNQQPPSERP